MNKSNKNSLQSLGRKRNLAREKLYEIMNQNEHEWQYARKVLISCENQFVRLLEAYKTDRNYIEDEFFMCCDQLYHYIFQERKMNEEFKKIYKPYYDKFQKLNKEYNQIKSQQYGRKQ